MAGAGGGDPTHAQAHGAVRDTGSPAGSKGVPWKQLSPRPGRREPHPVVRPPDAHGTRDTNTSEAVGVRGRGAVGTAAHGRTHDPARERGRHPAAARGGADTSHRVRKPEIQVFTGNLIFKSDLKKKKNRMGKEKSHRSACTLAATLLSGEVAQKGVEHRPSIGRGGDSERDRNP